MKIWKLTAVINTRAGSRTEYATFDGDDLNGRASAEKAFRDTLQVGDSISFSARKIGK
jgi:hypothetical protein